MVHTKKYIRLCIVCTYIVLDMSDQNPDNEHLVCTENDVLTKVKKFQKENV